MIGKKARQGCARRAFLTEGSFLVYRTSGCKPWFVPPKPGGSVLRRSSPGGRSSRRNNPGGKDVRLVRPVGVKLVFGPFVIPLAFTPGVVVALAWFKLVLETEPTVGAAD